MDTPTTTEQVVVCYVDDAGWKEYELPTELRANMTGTQEDAEKLAEAILREWLHATNYEASSASDYAEEEDYDEYTGTLKGEWYVIGVYGNETEGNWMAICAPDRGERVQFMFLM